jgi:hypothetical protein
MLFRRRQTVPPILGHLLGAFAVTTLGTGLQVEAPDSRPPTAIEEALIEFACGARVGRAPETEAYQECLSGQLRSLRADFGRDLGQLSSADRRTIDSACNKTRAAEGREAYLECLSAHLTSIHDRRLPAHLAPSESTALPSPSAGASSAGPVSPTEGASSVPPGILRSRGLWIVAALAAVFVAGGGAFLAAKSRRRPATKCRTCGADVPERGELCQKCRHAAAEVLRRAAADRVEQQAALERDQRRQEHEDDQRRQKALDDETARLLEREQVSQREEDARRQEEEARQRGPAPEIRPASEVASPPVIDPYTVLGVARDASRETIDAAYREAKLKYDPDQAVGMGYDLLEHFKTKAHAVDHAYQLLTAQPPLDPAES